MVSNVLTKCVETEHNVNRARFDADVARFNHGRKNLKIKKNPKSPSFSTIMDVRPWQVKFHRSS